MSAADRLTTIIGTLGSGAGWWLTLAERGAALYVSVITGAFVTYKFVQAVRGRSRSPTLPNDGE